MSWVPLDLRSVCTPYATITACQPSTYMFLQLVVSLFGSSKDSSPLPEGGSSVYNFQSSVFQNFDGFQHSDQHEGEFDFIIVGAGTAGCTLANRLTEVHNWKVLLIEAGGEEPDVVDVPSFALMMQRSSIDWGFATQPQPKSCRARPQGRCNWPRGRVVGGSSSINLMIYLRGGPKDFDEWEHLGNTGWSYKDVLPYFIKSEQNNNIGIVDKRFHGTDGEVSIEYFPYQDQNIPYILAAYEELGLNIFDQNSDRQLGASLIQHYTRDGQRVSANDAFIRPIRRKRSNLVLLTKSFVTKVLINPETKTAYGVEYFCNGQYFQVFANKEVIVSAGTLLSPKLLMLSGVGPARHLNDMNIKVIKDLNVGYNLHDHTTADGPLFALTNKTATTVTDQQEVQDLLQFKQFRRGPLAGTSTIQVNSFIQSKFEHEEDRPDVQFTIDPMNVQDYCSDPVLFGATNIQPMAYYNGFMIRPVLLAPKSRGYILLNQTHPVFGDPVIYPNTFYVEGDLERLVDATQRIINIANTQALQKLGATLVAFSVPGCDHIHYGSDEYWRCVFTLYTGTLYHLAGTCRMGPKYDKGAVVDPLSLSVHGIKRLRVIDASVMPIVTRANSNAATMMIAEKGADFIKRDWLAGHEYNGPVSFKRDWLVGDEDNGPVSSSEEYVNILKQFNFLGDSFLRT